MTPAQLRQFPGFENISDEEACQVIAKLRDIAEMFFESYQSQHEQPERISSVRRDIRAA